LETLLQPETERPAQRQLEQRQPAQRLPASPRGDDDE
jgi:hypothetical protein